MKKIISLFLMLIVGISVTGCFSSSDPLSRINFESGTIDIDTKKIEDYVMDHGYDSFELRFDVDKSIYQCSVSLSKEESEKIIIDGEGYDAFIASARKFLTEGTGVMSDVLKSYELTGISCGMFLMSNDGVVYCAAINGTVNYVGHVKSDSVSANDIKQNIERVANAILNDKLTITLNNSEKIISVFYEGPNNGGSEQTQESVDTAFDAIAAYLKEAGFNGYRLSVYSYDGFPKKEDKNSASEDASEDTGVGVPENLTYNCIGQTETNYYMLEAVATEETAETVARKLISVATKELNSTEFVFYIVDANQKLLGHGSANGYEKYVYKETYLDYTKPSFEIPFDYYFYKYFSNIEAKSRRMSEEILPGGVREYTLVVDAVNAEERSKCQTAAETVVRLMNITLGNDIQVVVKVFEGTENEIAVRSVLP